MNNSKVNIPCILVLSLMVSGCELIGPKLHEKLPIKLADEIAEVEQPEVIYQELSNEASQVVDESRVKVELYPGTGEFVSQKGVDTSGKAKGRGEYSLNFDDADLGEVTKVILSDILGENYVLSPKVSGKVTLQTSQPLSREELLPTLDLLLQINNVAMVYQDGIYQIKPKADAPGSSILSNYNRYQKKTPAGFRLMAVPIRNVAVEELSEIIKPLLQDKTILHVDSSRNMMLIAGTASELDRAMEMVNVFDVDVMKGKSFGLFPLHKVDAAKIIEELEQIFNQKAENPGGFIQFMNIERLNAILAITHQTQSLKEIERWIIRLDRANTSAGGGAIVYRVQHVDAVELAATLNEIFSQGRSDRDRPASVAAGRQAVEITNRERPEQPERQNQNLAITSGITELGDVKVIADEVNNALIIVATAQDYAVVQQVIRQLDVMPLQVLIDATIVEVTLEDELKYGIKWFLSHGDGVATSGGLATLFEDGAKAAAFASSGGFGYAFISGDFKALLDFSASDDNLNVIASPSLMVLNNQEASIRVGDEVPILTSSSTNISGGFDNVVTNSIEQRETGVKLRVVPRVNASGLVIMEIEQSVENVKTGLFTGSGSSIDSPTISTREIISSVAIHSGETIVLGGLIQEQEEYNKAGIPVLYDIPWIGPLFGTTKKTLNKTELVVLITPRVVSTRKDARLITNEFKRKLSGIYDIEPELLEIYETEPR